MTSPERRDRILWRTALVGALVCHLPYGQWLLEVSEPLSGVRTGAALLAAGLLTLLHFRRAAGDPPPGSGSPEPNVAGLFLSAAILGGFASVHAPWGWILSVPCLIAGTLVIRGWTTVRRGAVALSLGAIAFPYERVFGAVWDPILQRTTAAIAEPVVRGTGLAVTLEQWNVPVLVGDQLLVRVTALCAGSGTLLSLLTMGFVISDVFLEGTRKKILFVALAPLFGFLGNVLRVIVSTHAADRWGHDPLAWSLAHDGIGYATFLGTYALLFITVRRFRRNQRSRPRPATAVSTMRPATPTIHGPQRT